MLWFLAACQTAVLLALEIPESVGQSDRTDLETSKRALDGIANDTPPHRIQGVTGHAPAAHLTAENAPRATTGGKAGKETEDPMGGIGSGGRNRKPAAVKLAEGNRGRRKISNEPIASGDPKLPDYFTPEEQRLWFATLASAPQGLLHACDTAILEVFVSSWNTLRQVNRQLAQADLLVEGDGGRAVKNPLLSIRRMTVADLQMAGQAIGLSPFARSRLVAPDAPDDDPMSLLLAWDASEDPASRRQ